jgi:hypothetical protein
MQEGIRSCPVMYTVRSYVGFINKKYIMSLHRLYNIKVMNWYALPFLKISAVVSIYYFEGNSILV